MSGSGGLVDNSAHVLGTIKNMNRSDFQELADLRVKEAEVLLNQKLLDGAYYLLGYAVECAFKACIAKQTKQYDFPPDRKAVEAIYQHDPIKLLKASGLESEYKKEIQTNIALADNWKIVERWLEQSRYQMGKSEPEVRDFYSAVVSNEGVLSWLKKYW